jgi:hypothetical protein
LSTILKALRRLEEEKAAAEEPRPLREQIATTPLAGERPRRRGWLAAAVSLVLGVAAGGSLIWWLFAGSSQTVQVQVAAAAPEVAPIAAPAPPSAPAVEPAPAPAPPPAHVAVAGPPEQAFHSDVEIVDRPEALPRLADDEPIEPAREEPAPGSTRPVESSAAMIRARRAALAEQAAADRARQGLPPQVAAPAPAADAAQPAHPTRRRSKIVEVAPEILVPVPVDPEPAPAAQPQQKIAAAEPQHPAAEPAPEPAPEPKPAAQPKPKPQVREAAAPRPVTEVVRQTPEPVDDLPSFAIEKTQWHPLPDRRVAWLRMPGESESRRVVEGDVVDGLIVSKIEPSGVVFERDGKKIERVLGKR